MSTKMKGLLKGLRYISQIFDNNGKEQQEMEIGYPTDVKHVAHIGWDGPSIESPSWMNEFRPESELPSASPVNGVAESKAKDLHQTGARDIPDLPKPSRRQPFLGSPSSVNNSPSIDQPKQARRHQSTTAVSISSPSRDVTVSSRSSRRAQNASMDSSLPDQPADPKKSRRRKSKESSGGGGSTRPSRSKAPSTTIYTSPFSDPGSGGVGELNSDIGPKSPLKRLGNGEGERGGHGIS
ncbi:CRIB domain-containing protein RIC7-like [Telopea speciosissima]|uniref:CRIB domain-containing protein RIC7-like n=1 Tax=Telopea speciosissima TaxID=54955 RepID=UPI001CC4F350|nr:CRIB domain-containing protein RIC7-like [Telopea speciosissima]